MKSKASCFSLSGPLFMENLRRYWAYMAVAFIAYFLAGASPILMNMGQPDLRDAAGYIDNLLQGQNPVFIAMGFIIPLTCAVVVLNYMQRSASATSIHAMPFSRAKLYNTSVVSGFVMTILPYLLTVIILLLLARPTYSLYDYTDMGILEDDAVNIFTRSRILVWAAESIVSMLFVYAISIFGGIISGNSVMHTIMAVCWNWLAPAISLVFVYLAGVYFYGYTNDLEWLVNLSPVMKTVMPDVLSAKFFVIYIVTAVLILVFSAFLYGKRKLERTGDAIVFGWMKPILCCLFTLFVTILSGIYFEALGVLSNSYISCYLGYVIGAIVGYIVARMIVFKTPKVFNLATLKGFAVYAVLVIALFSAFIFDVTGYETRVPDAKSIDAAYISIPEIGAFSTYDRFDPTKFNMEEDEFYKNNHYSVMAKYEDEANIEAVRSLHAYLAENRKLSNRRTLFGDDFDYDPNEVYDNVTVLYNLGGKSFKRAYYVKQSAFLENEDLRTLYESKEFKEMFALTNIDMLELNNISVDANFSKKHENFGNAEAQELLEAMSKDFEERSFDEETSAENLAYVDLNIYYHISKEVWGSNYSYEGESIYLPLHYSDKNTIAWLAAHGFEDVTTIPVEYVRSVAVLFEDTYIHASTDKEMIEFLLKNGLHSSQRMPYNAYFAVDLYPSADTAKNRLELEEKYNDGYGDMGWDDYNSRVNVISDSMFAEIYIPASKVPDEYYNLFTKNKRFVDRFVDDDVRR